jgi:cell division transport system permease protein
MNPIYFLRRALRNMRQSPFLSIATIGTVTVSLTILAVFAIFVLNVQQVTRSWSKDVMVIAYLDTTPDPGQLHQWKGAIEAMPEVAGVTYVSPKEALQRFKKRLAGNADLLDGLDPDVLPASLEITLKDSFRTRGGVSTVVGRLRKNPVFSDLRYGRDWLSRFESFVTLLKLVGAILGGFLLFATLFIVSNTIKLTLYARREELEVMALVGGTSLFIKTPYLLEGGLQGACGGLLALAGSYALFGLFLQKGLSAFLLAAGLGGAVYLSPLPQVGLVAAGVFLGLFGSLLSLRKLVRI